MFHVDIQPEKGIKISLYHSVAVSMERMRNRMIIFLPAAHLPTRVATWIAD
jgi:hypothetical protein